MKRFFAFLLTLAMVMGLLPAGMVAMAADVNALGTYDPATASYLYGTELLAEESIDVYVTNEWSDAVPPISLFQTGTAEAAYQTIENGDWAEGTFAEAVSGVYAGGTVKLLQDVYLTETITLSKDMSITSNDAVDLKMITCAINGHGYLLNISSGTVALSNVVVDGGYDENAEEKIYGQRALIAVNGGDLVLNSGTEIRNNYNVTVQGAGGGICLINGTVTMTGGKIYNNYACSSGGVAILQESTNVFTMTGGSVENNTAVTMFTNRTYTNGWKVQIRAGGYGGGFGISAGKLAVNGGSIKNNTAQPVDLYQTNTNVTPNETEWYTCIGGFGGGIAMYSSSSVTPTVEIIDSTIEGNDGFYGGGMYVVWGSVTIENSKIKNNTATSKIVREEDATGGYMEDRYGGHGGGIYLSNGNLTITSSEITGNSAGYYGGGIYQLQGGINSDNELTSSSNLNLSNITITGNNADSCAGIYVSGSNKSEWDGTGTWGTTKLSNVEITRNTAASKGGGVLVAPYQDVMVSGAVKIHGNTAPDHNNFLLDNDVEWEFDPGRIVVMDSLAADAVIYVDVCEHTTPYEAVYQLVAVGSDTYTITQADYEKFKSDNTLYITEYGSDSNVYLVPGYTVTYNLSGGIGADDIDYTTAIVAIGTEITVKAAPTRDGYTFTNWSDGTSTYQPGDKITVDSNITLTAQWKKIETPVDPPADNTAVKEIMIDTRGIDDPIKEVNANNAEQYQYLPSDYLYFGLYDNTPVLWRVLDADQTNIGTAGMLLMSELLYGSTPTDEEGSIYFSDPYVERIENGVTVYYQDDTYAAYANDYQGSQVQAWCAAFTSTDYFTIDELNTILSVTKIEPTQYADAFGIKWTLGNIHNEKIFCLSSKEIVEYVANYQLATALGANPYYGEGRAWWLRSAQYDTTLNAGMVTKNPFVTVYAVRRWDASMRPAMNLDLDAILFTSAAIGGKTDTVDSNLKLISDYTGNEWKATIYDASRSNFTAEVLSGTATEWMISYSNAVTGNNEYISALVADENGDAVYYGNLALVDGASEANGTVVVTLPDGFDLSKNTLYIFNEQLNADKQSDYSGSLIPVEYEKVTEYTVTYNLNSGIGADGVDYSTVTVSVGTEIIVKAAPTRDGYTFIGWSDGTTTHQPNDKITVNSNTTLTAQWNEVPKYTVVYNLNGGTEADGVDYSSVTVSAGTEITVKASPTRDGYSFTGWSDGMTTYQPNDKITVNSNITLTAQWEKIEMPVDPPIIIPMGTAELIKVDADDNTTVLPGVVFELYRANGSKVGTYTTNANGEIRVSSLITGNYYWKEIRSAEGYILDSTTHPFTVSMWKTTSVVIENEKSHVPDVFIDDHYAYIIGYDDGLVHPEANITRAEVATIFFRLLDEETRNLYMTRENDFTDVNEDAWYNTAVSTMAAMGIVTGRPGGIFDPNANITRAEFAAIAARFDTNRNTTGASFTDIYDHWAMKEINIAANNGWVLGYEDGTFRPDQNITRAETMTMVNRVLQRIPESVDDLHPDMVQWADNMDTTKWYYLMVQEATNSHDYIRKENGYESWLGLRETPDWTKLERVTDDGQ